MRHGTAASQAGLLAKITRLGTNLLTVTDGQTLAGQTAELPDAARAMIRRPPRVTSVQDAAGPGVRAAAGPSVARRNWLAVPTACQPVAVLGAAAAQRLRIDRIW